MDEEYIEEIEKEFPTKEECKGSLRRKRRSRRVAYFRMKRVIASNYLYGFHEKGKSFWDESPVRYKRLWRGSRSRDIKRECTHKYRRRHKRPRNYDLAVSRSKAIKHRETEFWWELD